MKYPTLKEFLSAQKTGTTKARLTVDSWCVYAYEKNEQVFEMHNTDFQQEMMDLLGLKYNYC